MIMTTKLFRVYARMIVSGPRALPWRRFVRSQFLRKTLTVRPRNCVLSFKSIYTRTLGVTIFDRRFSCRWKIRYALRRLGKVSWRGRRFKLEQNIGGAPLECQCRLQVLLILFRSKRRLPVHRRAHGSKPKESNLRQLRIPFLKKTDHGLTQEMVLYHIGKYSLRCACGVDGL